MERKHAHFIGPIIATLAALSIPLTSCTSPGQQGESKQVHDKILDETIRLSNGSTLYVGGPQTSNLLDSYEPTDCLGLVGEFITYFLETGRDFFSPTFTFHSSTFKLVSEDGLITQRWYLVWLERRTGNDVWKSEFQVLTGEPTCFDQFFRTGGKEVSNDNESGVLSWLTSGSKEKEQANEPSGELGVLYSAVVAAAIKLNDFDKKLPSEVWGVVQGAAEDLHARSWNEFDRAAVDAAVNGEVSSDLFPNAVTQEQLELILAAASGSCTKPSPEATMGFLNLSDIIDEGELVRFFHVTKDDELPGLPNDIFSLVIVIENPDSGEYNVRIQKLYDDGSGLSLGKQRSVNLEDISVGSHAVRSDVVAVTHDTKSTAIVFEIKKTDVKGKTSLTGLLSVSINTADLFEGLARNPQIHEWTLPELDNNTRLDPISAASVELMPGGTPANHHEYLRGVLFTETVETGRNGERKEAVISFAGNSNTELHHLQTSNGSPYDPEENYTAVAVASFGNKEQKLSKEDVVLLHLGNEKLLSFVLDKKSLKHKSTSNVSTFAPWDEGNKGLLESRSSSGVWFHLAKELLETGTFKGATQLIDGSWPNFRSKYPKGTTMRPRGFIVDDRLFEMFNVVPDEGGVSTHVSVIRICG